MSMEPTQQTYANESVVDIINGTFDFYWDLHFYASQLTVTNDLELYY